MTIRFPKIYAITDTSLSGISHAEQTGRLIKGGIRLIQLRDKSASPREFYKSAAAAVIAARKHKVTVIINDRVDIALTVGADGVHLGQDDLSPDAARKILGPKAIIGISTHTLDQARIAMHFPIDYIAIGPVFNTKTKDDPDATVGLEIVAAVKRMIAPIPLVAIGGITSGNIKSVLAAGADSAALISDLVSDADRIEEMAEKLISQADSVE